MGTQEHNSYGATLIISDIRRANLLVAALRDMLVPNRHSRDRVSQSAHQLGNGCAALLSRDCDRVPQVVEAQIITPSGPACPLPVPLEGSAAPDLLTLRGRKEEGVFAQPNMILNGVLDGGHEVRRDRDIANASIGLRSADGRLAVDPRHTVRQQGSSRRADDQPPH